MHVHLDTVFRERAARQPKAPAILGPQPGQLLTYEGLDAAIDQIAGSLRAAGVQPGQAVGLHFRSGREYIIHNYAIWRCGAYVVPLPVELTPSEKRGIADTIALDFLVSQPRGVSAVVDLWDDPPGELPPGVAAGPLRRRCPCPPELETLHPAFIRFTSGTTGAFKGVVLSHQTIYDRIHAANDVLQIGPEDRVAWVLSMSYHFAVSIVAYLSFGAAIVLTPHNFAHAVYNAARDHHATILYAAPMHYAWMADFVEAEPIESLRLAISTTSPLEPAIGQRFLERMGIPATQALGIIEVGLPFINVDGAARRCEAVGRVLPAYELKLQDVGLGPQAQEILLRGKGLLDAYYQPWKPRAEILADGWFHTGDVGYVDPEGCLVLQGRVKDLISVMGMKFFPQEVEAVIGSHPDVEQVSVFGHRDARHGEVAWARIVPRDGADAERLLTEIDALCRERLADYKVPQHVELVASLPRTASGKVVRREAAS